ncbi:MAG: hypothetical protein JNM17_11850 [Archangium sp.]|nr:hypothetical protein [Archangium sp.]
MMRALVRSLLLIGSLLAFAGCEVTSLPDAAVPGEDAGSPDAGMADAGPPDASTDAGTDAGIDAGYVVPNIVIGRSLFWNDAGLLDDASTVSFAKIMGVAADDGHGGALLAQWFHRFNTTPHSERALPAQFIDAVLVAQGADPTQWDLSVLPFKVTGIHNRIDLAKLSPGGHCGELRVSVSSTDVTLQPFHALFLFRQPLEADDVEPGSGRVTCVGTARRWAELSSLDETAAMAQLRVLLARGLTHQRFLMMETVEFTLAPWEWRQWLPAADGGVENPPLFQQLDVERINRASPMRDDFLEWVDQNAAQLDARQVEFPERFRVQSVRVNQGVPRVPLNVPANPSFPMLRQKLEIVGCAACHTTDAEFVQTRTDRSVSAFYEKELAARALHLARFARGEAPGAPFGPLQMNPVLPP